VLLFSKSSFSVVMVGVMCFSGLLCPDCSGVDVYFDITASQTKKIDIALPLFNTDLADQGELLREIHSVFTQDFEFSGRFNTIDISPFYPAATKEIINPDFGQYYLVGIQALLTGFLNQAENGDYRLSIRLFDVRMGQQIVGIRYTTPLSGIRSVVHKFADEVQYRLTGERGINDTRIAFSSRRTGTSELYLIDSDGSHMTQITRNNSINLSPAWSTDNTRLFFTSYIEKYPDLYAIDLSTREMTSLLSGGMHITPSPSPDGIHLVLSISFDGFPEIVIYNLEKRSQRRLTFSKGVDTNPVFAPNGREIVFVSDRTGTPQLFVMDIDGANVRRLTYQGTYNTSPDWSPRGDWIAYHSRRDGVFDIWMIRPDGSDEHQVTSGTGHNEDPTFARNGRHLAFTSTRDGSKGLYVMDLSGRKVRRLIQSMEGCANPAWSR
jgi:TolB protein